jgi:hypothetical protein
LPPTTTTTSQNGAAIEKFCCQRKQRLLKREEAAKSAASGSSIKTVLELLNDFQSICIPNDTTYIPLKSDYLRLATQGSRFSLHITTIFHKCQQFYKARNSPNLKTPQQLNFDGARIGERQDNRARAFFSWTLQSRSNLANSDPAAPSTKDAKKSVDYYLYHATTGVAR